MTRRPDGMYEVSSREMRRVLLILPMLQLVFSAGAAWAGVHFGLDSKVDKADFAIHTQATALEFQRLRISDSLQQATAADDRARLREIVCQAIRGCR